MSSPSTLARPYARAAFETAQGANALASWQNALVFSALVAEEPAARRLLGHPAVEDTELVSLFMPKDGAPEAFEAFLTVLAENQRLGVLPEIAEQFTTLKDQAEQTLSVTVESAQPLSDEYRHQLERALARRFGKNIEMDVKVDESMLGGAVIRAGDTVIDGSVRGKLARMAAALTR